MIDVYDEGDRIAKMMLGEGLSIKHLRTLAQKAERREPKLLEETIMSFAHNRKWEYRSVKNLLNLLVRCEGNTDDFKRAILDAIMKYPYYRRFGSGWRR